MNEQSELTPRESFQADLYKDPARLFRRTLIRKLTFIIPSIALMLAWLITKDPAYAYMGYGLLLFQAVQGIFLSKNGFQTTNKLMAKYERKIQDKGGNV